MGFWSKVIRFLETSRDTQVLTLGNSVVTFGSLMSALLILLTAMLLSRIAGRLLKNRLFPRTRLGEGAQFTLRRMTHFVILTLGVLIAIDTLGVDLTTLSVFASLVGVGIGFGLQGMVSNVISGFTLLLERPIQVGDWVEFEGIYGRVDSINIRTSTIVTEDNIAQIVPNSMLVQSRVANWSAPDPRTRLLIAVGVSYGADPRRVTEILTAVCDRNARVLKTPPPGVGFMGFGDSALDFRVAAWIAHPRDRWTVASDLRYEMFAALKEAGVEIPFPQRDVHIKSA